MGIVSSLSHRRCCQPQPCSLVLPSPTLTNRPDESTTTATAPLADDNGAGLLLIADDNNVASPSKPQGTQRRSTSLVAEKIIEVGLRINSSSH
ncbi:hypothetical protein G4B88_028435 [Cannabis sativa]|uniref:Uncharacterized protein n=1 Tax=Cannabis sativa TaxID=3483 RepID=A0A7J6E4G0_CANSA|nr:hypothetical protein G4B88_028435 [Cannabis sativa]